MKIVIKGHPNGRGDVLRNQRISSKKLKWNEFM
jgi:hypothetical protein